MCSEYLENTRKTKGGQTLDSHSGALLCHAGDYSERTAYTPGERSTGGTPIRPHTVQ